ncbi:MAG: molybdate ABC transporter substrate-binding protein [Actinomycetota bacterium]
MRRLLPLTLACALVLPACGSGITATQKREEILVFAAASLTEVFRSMNAAFGYTHPDVLVRFNFGPSDGLATGLAEGAPADVFASASTKWMDAVATKPGVRQRAVFARNSLTVIVPKANPAHVARFADLARPGVKLVLAAASVPVGTYARQALAKAGLERAERNVVSNEEDVKGVVQKILLGEADAGIVYRTDVTSAVSSQITAIPIANADNVIASYEIGVLETSDHRSAARAFVAYVLGPGQEALREAGFLAP